ncbi:MAG: hypothetical protein KDD44_04105, partial [Bdellovibrionales bacterium]|nr:hypothetical protein [Bdellovibrionales bacterium]
ALFFMKGKPGTGGALSGLSSVVPSTGARLDILPENGGAFPTGSAAQNITGDVSLVATVSRDNFGPAAKYLTQLRERLATTKLWQATGIDAQLDMAMQAMLEGSDLEGETGEPFTMSELVKGMGMYQDVTVALSNATFEPKPGTAVPQLMVHAALNLDGEAAQKYEQLRARLAEVAAKGAYESGDNRIEFTPQPGKAHSYSLMVNSTSEEMSFPGYLALEDSALVAVAGATSPDAFLSNSGTPVIEQEKWKQVGAVVTPKSAFSMLVDGEQFSDQLVSLFEAASKMEGMTDNTMDMRAMLKQQWGAFGPLAMSADFFGALNSYSCLQLRDADTSYGKLLSGLVKRMASRPNDTSQFKHLVSDNALLALHFRLDILPFYVQMMRESYEPAFRATPELQNSWKEFNAALNRVEEVYNRFEFQGFGIVVNGPTAGPMPDPVVLVTGSKIGGKALLEALAKELNDIAEAQSGMRPATITESQNEPMLMVGDANQPTSIVGLLAGENSVLLGINPAVLRDARGRLERGESVLDSAQVSGVSLAERLARGDYYLYLNSELALRLLGPWLPMLMQQQAAQLSPDDVQEFAQQFAGRFLAYSATSPTGSDGMCSVQQWLTF